MKREPLLLLLFKGILFGINNLTVTQLSICIKHTTYETPLRLSTSLNYLWICTGKPVGKPTGHWPTDPSFFTTQVCTNPGLNFDTAGTCHRYLPFFQPVGYLWVQIWTGRVRYLWVDWPVDPDLCRLTQVFVTCGSEYIQVYLLVLKFPFLLALLLFTAHFMYQYI